MRFLIDLDPGDPRRGLAIDEVILDSARGDGQETIRAWVNDRAVIVGRSQSVADEVDAAFAAAAEIPVLRRITGGGTVCHYPGNLNVSVALSDGCRIGSVREAFRFFGEVIARAVCGVCPSISARENDLLIGTAKVGGAAQARRGNAVLYHTTLLVEPVDVPMERLLLAMRPGYAPRGVPSRPRRTTSLQEAAGRELTMEDVAGLVAAALGDALGERLHAGRLTDEEEQRAAWLARTKYGDPGWNRSLPPIGA